MTTSSPDLARQLLLDQLGIVWGFAERFVWPQIDGELIVWEPSTHTVNVRPSADGEHWSADWSDEDAAPLPEATVGWLLWHIDWWWTNALRACHAEDAVSAADHEWSGSLESIRSSKLTWERLLGEASLDMVVTGLMPQPKPLWFVAGWVNFELTKNVTEIHQLIIRRANTAAPNG